MRSHRRQVSACAIMKIYVERECQMCWIQWRFRVMTVILIRTLFNEPFYLGRISCAARNWSEGIGHEGSFHLMTCIKHPDSEMSSPSINAVSEVRFRRAKHALPYSLFRSSLYRAVRLESLTNCFLAFVCCCFLIKITIGMQCVQMKQTLVDLNFSPEKVQGNETRERWRGQVILISRRLWSFSFHSKVKYLRKFASFWNFFWLY